MGTPPARCAVSAWTKGHVGKGRFAECILSPVTDRIDKGRESLRRPTRLILPERGELRGSEPDTRGCDILIKVRY